jgi:hypothetical protein
MCGKEEREMTIEEKFMMYEEKRKDFAGFVKVIKKQSEVGKKLKTADYHYEVKSRAYDPTKYFTNEWLEIEADGYRYKINAAYNSALANEQQLMAALICPEEIQGLIEKCEC